MRSRFTITGTEFENCTKKKQKGLLERILMNNGIIFDFVFQYVVSKVLAFFDIIFLMKIGM